MKIGIFLPNWLGDLVMATPMLRAIRRHFAQPARLVGVLRPNLSEVLAGTGWLDEQWYFDPRADQPELRHTSLIRRMRRERFEMAILLTNSLRTALVAWLGGAQQRIGYVRCGRGPLLTSKLYPRRQAGRLVPQPMVDYYLALAAAIGCPPESPRLELSSTPAEDCLAERIWHELGLRSDGRLVTFNCSGAYGAAKLWPTEYFGQLARRVVDEMDHDVLIVCGSQERQIAQEIVGHARRSRVFSMAEQSLGLAASKACIRRGRLMVSTDSGPRHIAAAYGQPVITLFGPTLPTWIENPTVRAVNLQLDLPCTGCYQRVCPLGHHRCMRDLSVDAVAGEVAGLLGERRIGEAA
jgi:heptosyltransferase-2